MNKGNRLYFDVDGIRLFHYEGNVEILHLPDFITTICRQAFANNQTIVKVILPLGLKRIDQRAFYKCQHLKTLTLPSSIEFIGKEAFYGCSNLRKVTWSNETGNVEIGTGAFQNCSSLQDFSFPIGIKNIPSKVLKDCRSLETVNFQDAESFFEDSIENCNKIKTTYCYENSVADVYLQLLLLKSVLLHPDNSNLPYEIVHIGKSKHSSKTNELIEKAEEFTMCELGFSLPDNFLDHLTDVDDMTRHFITRLWRDKRSNSLEQLIEDKIKDYKQDTLSLEEIVGDNLLYRRIQLCLSIEELSNVAHVPFNFIFQYEENTTQNIFKNLNYVKNLLYHLKLSKEQAFTSGFVFYKVLGSKIKQGNVNFMRLHLDNKYYKNL